MAGTKAPDPEAPACLFLSSGCCCLLFSVSVAEAVHALPYPLRALYYCYVHAQYAFNPNSQYPCLFVGGLPQAIRTCFAHMHRRAGNA